MAEVWGQLNKSAIDNETIEEAIARLILEHDEDPEAHLGEGGSLLSHKASEIIDHLATSIIADKIASGEITRPKLADDAVVFTSENFDKGLVIDFSTFSEFTSGSGVANKALRLNDVRTGSTQNSVASVYTQFEQAGNFWDPSQDLEFIFSYYFYDDWGWEYNHGTELFLKYGSSHGADMGDSADKVFGIKFEDLESGEIKATAFVRDLSTLKTEEFSMELELGASYAFRIVKTGGTFYFYVDGVLACSITEAISGSVSTPYLTHAITNPNNGGYGRGFLNQFFYYFPH
jgi:hypothetical protein